MEGHAVATGIHEIIASDTNDTNENTLLSPTEDMSKPEIDFNDTFFRPGFTDPFRKEDKYLVNLSTTTQSEFDDLLSTTERETKRMPFQMGRTIGDAQFVGSEEQTTAGKIKIDSIDRFKEERIIANLVTTTQSIVEEEEISTPFQLGTPIEGVDFEVPSSIINLEIPGSKTGSDIIETKINVKDSGNAIAKAQSLGT